MSTPAPLPPYPHMHPPPFDSAPPAVPEVQKLWCFRVPDGAVTKADDGEGTTATEVPCASRLPHSLEKKLRAEVAAAVMGRMIRVGPAGREAAVAVLWMSCCAGGGERRMREAVAAAPEAVGKLLVVMQGDWAPTTSRMAGELLRAVRLEQERKGMAAAYDSRTIHVMPY